MPLIEEFQQSWRENGAMFGYPQCCIDWFVERATKIMQAKTMDEINPVAAVFPSQQGYSYGFIPCPECAKKVTPGTENSLITNRTFPKPYPIDHENF